MARTFLTQPTKREATTARDKAAVSVGHGSFSFPKKNHLFLLLLHCPPLTLKVLLQSQLSGNGWLEEGWLCSFLLSMQSVDGMLQLVSLA